MLKLKEIRESKGLTRADIAQMLGVTTESVRRYETEERKLDQDSIMKLCFGLEVTPDELLGYQEAYDKYTKYLQSLDEEEVEQ